MGLKIYEIKSWSIPETQDAQDKLFEEKVKSGEWSEDVLLGIDMPKLEKERIEDAVEKATQGKEWYLGFSQIDMHGCLEFPLIYETYIEYLETTQEDFLGENVMTKRMLDIILSTGIQATSYPVAILERRRIEELSASKLEGMSANDVDELVIAFRKTAETRYQFLHLLTEIALFAPEKSDRRKRHYVLAESQPALPPFFRVAWGPRSALLCTEQGKARLEDAGLLGLHFDEVDVQEPATA